MSDKPKCELCGEPMPIGEEMFKYHGYSGTCPKPPLPKKQTEIERLTQELALKDADLLLNRDRAEKAEIKAMEQGRHAVNMFDECKRAQVTEQKTKAQVKMLVEALKWYADPIAYSMPVQDMNHHVFPDRGKVALEVLAKIKEESASSPTPDANTDSQ